MSKLLSIIIPVYQVEQYINKCLDSLIIESALMDLMDVLIINDGTTDRSADISREYVSRYPGVFRQIDKPNGGHGSVWNLGVKDAYGKYVKFLDSDDWLENLDVMIKKLQKTDADLIVTSCICHCPNQELWKLEIRDMEFDKVYDADSFNWIGNRSHRNYTFHHCAIYKTVILRQYLPLFLEKQPYDDVILCAAPIMGAKSLVAWNLEVYHYLMDRPGQSISLEVQQRNIDAKIKVYQSTIDFIEKHPVTDVTSSKYPYFQKKLKQCYEFGYKSLAEILPSGGAKEKIKQWDQWIADNHSDVSTKCIKMYRSLPYPVFSLCLHVVKAISSLKRKFR